jgi:hypothetical protein
LAYKDLKPSHFEELLAFAQKHAVSGEFLVDKAYLLKKVEGRWKVIAPIVFGSSTEDSSPIAIKETT